MKQRVLSVLLIFGVLFTLLPMIGVSASGYQYGIIEEIYYNDNSGSLDLYIATPGSSDFSYNQERYELPAGIPINGQYWTKETAESLLPAGATVRFSQDFLDGSDGISFIQADATANLTGTYTYNPSTGTFSGLDSSTAELPVLLFEEGWLNPVYLDGNHEYEIEVYDYGILVTAKWAINKEVTIDSVRMDNNPNAKLRAEFTFTARGYAPGGTLHATLCNDSGSELDTLTASFSNYKAEVTFTDLPDENANYTIKAWVTTNGSVVSPVYEYRYTQKRFYSGMGTVVSVYKGRYALELELDIGEEWTDSVSVSAPAIVGGVLYEDLDSLQSAPLLTVGSLIRYVEGNNLMVIADGATTWTNYGRINSAMSAADGAEPVLEVSMTLPDGSTQVYKMDETATINDQSYTTLHEVYLALEEGFGGYAGFEISGERISSLSFNNSYTSYYDQEYEGSYRFFSALPGVAKKLPVYYKISEDDFAEAYLDDYYYVYDINYYEGFAVEITRMAAKEEGQLVIHRVTPTVSPNEEFLLDLTVTCDFDYVEDAHLMVRVEDSEYNSIADGYAQVTGTTGTVVIPDIPNVQENYRIDVWMVDGNFNNNLSPGYKKSYQLTPLPIGTGTIQETSYYGPANRYILTLEGASKDISCTTPVYINGYSYTEPDEMNILLKTGRQIEYMLDKDGRIGAIRYDDEKEYLYGRFQGYGYDWDEDSNYYMEVTFLLPDLTERTCRVNLDSWINGHRWGDWDEIDDIFWDSTGKYCAFATVGSTINALKISEEDTIFSSRMVTYDEASGTFIHPNLPGYDKKLPIYCCMSPDYEYVLPYLDGNHYYTIDLYDYAIQIVGMEAKKGSATITGIKTSVQPNTEFNYNVAVSVNASGVSGTSGWSLRAQLLDADNRAVKTASSAGSLSAVLKNIPNRGEEYSLRVWIEKNGAVISPVYTRAVTVPRGTVCYGTLMEDSHITLNGELQLKLSDPVESVGVVVTTFCTEEDTLPGSNYSSLEELQAVLKEGTMVRYIASGNNKVQVVEVLSVMNAITGTNYNEETKQLSAHIHLQSTDSTPAIGIIYAGVYSKDNILKRVAILADQELAAGGTVLTTIKIPDVDYENGDYVKVLFWEENNSAIAEPAEWDLVKE